MIFQNYKDYRCRYWQGIFYTLLMVCVCLILVYDFLSIKLFIKRLSYNWALEWQENVDAALISGSMANWYAVPISVESGATIYPPMYFLLGKLFMLFLPEGYIALRFFSAFIPLLLSCFVVESIGRNLGKKYTSLLFIFFTFVVLNIVPWIDLIRMEMWLLFFLILYTKYFLEEKFILLGVVIVIIALTKQSFIFLVCPVVLVALLDHSQYWKSVIIGTVGSILAFYVCFVIWGEGFLINIFEAKDHSILFDQLRLLLSPPRIMLPIVFLMLLPIVFLFSLYEQKYDRNLARRVYLSFDAMYFKLVIINFSVFLVCLLSLIKVGGWIFNIVLFLMFTCLFFSLFLQSTGKLFILIILSSFAMVVCFNFSHIRAELRAMKSLAKETKYNEIITHLVNNTQGDIYVTYNPYITSGQSSNILLFSPRDYSPESKTPLKDMGLGNFNYVITNADCVTGMPAPDDASFFIILAEDHKRLLLNEGYHLAATIHQNIIGRVTMGCTYFSRDIYVKNTNAELRVKSLLLPYRDVVHFVNQ